MCLCLSSLKGQSTFFWYRIGVRVYSCVNSCWLNLLVHLEYFFSCHLFSLSADYANWRKIFARSSVSDLIAVSIQKALLLRLPTGNPISLTNIKFNQYLLSWTGNNMYLNMFLFLRKERACVRLGDMRGISSSNLTFIQIICYFIILVKAFKAKQITFMYLIMFSMQNKEVLKRQANKEMSKGRFLRFVGYIPVIYEFTSLIFLV